MARTTKGRQLTEQHRLEQLDITRGIVAAVLKLFDKMFDPNRIDDSAAAFARAASAVVLAGRRRSHDTSFEYMHNFHAAEVRVVNPNDIPIDFDDLYDIDAAVADLAETTIAVSKRMSRKGYSRARITDATRSAVGGKVTAIVNDGGREVLANNIANGGTGRGPIGYARVVDADPCPFCAMLASRGVYYLGNDAPGVGLYGADSFEASNARFVGDGRFKVHDGCQCTLEPVYYDGEGQIQLPGNGNELAKEWAEVAAGRDDPLGAWRRWRESGTLPEDYFGPLQGTRRPLPTRHAGQAEGVSRRARDTRPTIALDDDTVRNYLDIYRDRVEGIQRELDALQQRGQRADDVPVMSLLGELKRLNKQIARYERHLR